MKFSTSLVVSFFLLLYAGCKTVGPSCNKADLKNLWIQGFSEQQVKSWGSPQKIGTSWCWAATAQNVMRFHKKSTEQCDIVAKAMNADEAGCCGTTPTECWNWGGKPELAFDKFGFSYSPANPKIHERLNWKRATDELCQGRPFISALDLFTGVRHSVVVTGYSKKYGVRIYDPALDDLIYESADDFFDDESPDYIRVRDTYLILPREP